MIVEETEGMTVEGMAVDGTTARPVEVLATGIGVGNEAAD